MLRYVLVELQAPDKCACPRPGAAPVVVATDLIRAAFVEYETGIELEFRQKGEEEE